MAPLAPLAAHVRSLAPIPQGILLRLGLHPETEVELDVFGNTMAVRRIGLRPGRGRVTTRLTTDQILALTKFAGEIVLEPGGVYAFLILIDEIGEERGFTLANSYRSGYEGGHGILRDGNDVFPPLPVDPSRRFDDPANPAALAAAHFPADMAARTAIAPGTDGYPDVDTWRDLTFWVEVAPAPPLPTSR